MLLLLTATCFITAHLLWLQTSSAARVANLCDQAYIHHSLATTFEPLDGVWSKKGFWQELFRVLSFWHMMCFWECFHIPGKVGCSQRCSGFHTKNRIKSRTQFRSHLMVWSGCECQIVSFMELLKMSDTDTSCSTRRMMEMRGDWIPPDRLMCSLDQITFTTSISADMKSCISLFLFQCLQDQMVLKDPMKLWF